MTIRSALGIAAALTGWFIVGWAAQEPPRTSTQRIVVDQTHRAPLPADTEVREIVAADEAIWFLALDHSTSPAEFAVYRWSGDGVKKLALPKSTSPAAVSNLLLDTEGRAYVIADGAVLAADGIVFHPHEGLRGSALKALIGRRHYWAITAENELLSLPELAVSPATKKLSIEESVQAWSVTAGGDLWFSVEASDGSRLYIASRADGQRHAADEKLFRRGLAITSLFSDRAGHLWVGYADGQIARYADGHVESYGPRSSAVTSIFEDALGNLYLLNDGDSPSEKSLTTLPRSARHRENSQFVEMSLEGMGMVRTIAFDAWSGTWVAGKEGPFRLQGLRELPWRRVAVVKDDATIAPYARSSVTKFAAEERHIPNVAPAFLEAKFSVLNSSHGLVHDVVSCITGDTSGYVYYGTGYRDAGGLGHSPGGGISRWDHRQFTNLTTANGLPSNTVQACVFDAANNAVWFGTDNGISRHTPGTTSFTNYLLGAVIRDLRLDASGGLWVATFNQGFHRVNASTGAITATYNTGSGLSSNAGSSIVVEPSGVVWMGTEGGGLYRLPPAGAPTRVTFGSDSNSIFDLELDASANLWIAVPYQGVWRRTAAGTFTQFNGTSNPPLGNSSNVVYTIYRDQGNNLWFALAFSGEAATPKVAVTYLPATEVNSAAPQFQSYNAANQQFPTNVILSVWSENASTMYFGSPGGGSMRLGGPGDAPGWPQGLSGYVFYSSPALADLDGNGDLEVIIGDVSGRVTAFRPNGSILWVYDTRNAIPSGRNPGQMSVQSSPAIGDVDGDGDPEVVVGLHGLRLEGRTPGHGGVVILSKTGVLKRIMFTFDMYGAYEHLPEDGIPEGVFSTPVLANMDSDPEPEILVGALDNRFYGWNGDGTPLAQADKDGDGKIGEDFIGDYTPYTPANSSDNFPGVRFVDDDGDGMVDEGNPADDDEDGKLDEDNPLWPFFTNDSIVSSAVVGDLNRNGVPAVIFGQDFSGGPDYYTGNTFTRGGILRVLGLNGQHFPGFPKGNLEQTLGSSPVLVDLDNDGYYEIIHGSGGDLSTVGDTPDAQLIGQLVYAWRRDGNPFRPNANGKLADTQGRSIGAFAVGDLDNDGAPELVIATASLRNKLGQLITTAGNPTDEAGAVGQMVYAFRTDGSLVPGFPVRPHPRIAGANLVGSVTLADVNGDNYLDIIVPVAGGLIVLDRNGHGVSGMGMFGNLQNPADWGEATSTPAIADIDLDGRLELVYGMGSGDGSTGIVRVLKLGPVNSTVQRSWPMWRRVPQRNAVFDLLFGQVQASESGSNLVLRAQVFAGRHPVTSVTADLSSVGGGMPSLNDSGAGGDQRASDGYFSVTVPLNAPFGRHLLTVSATDSGGRSISQTLRYVRRSSSKLLSVEPANIDFGSVAAGQMESRQINLMNVSNVSMTVSAVSSNNDQFRLLAGGPFPRTLAPGEVLMLTVTFNPDSSVGGRSATLTIQSDDATAPSRTVAMVGSSAGGAACSFGVNPASVATGENGQKGTMSITAAAGCSWTASSNASWAQVFPLSGTGPATLSYTIFPNFTPRARSAVITINGAIFSITQAAGTGSLNHRFVRLLYFNYFGRLPSQAEVDFQINNGLNAGGSRADMALNFFNSGEFASGGRFMAGLYVGLLTRDAEYGGWLFQRNALSEGIITQNSVVDNFLGSAEYQQKFGSPNNDEFVRLLYRHILLREARDDEVAFQAGGLTGGIPRAQLVSNFLNSAEFRVGTGPRLTSFLLFATLLQREVTTPEFQSYSSRFSAGTPLRDLLAEIVNGSEFSNALN